MWRVVGWLDFTSSVASRARLLTARGAGRPTDGPAHREPSMVIEALHRPQRSVRLRLAVALVAGSALLLALLARLAAAQSRTHEGDVPKAAASAVDSAAHHMMDGHTPASNASLHVEMTP